MDNWTIEEAYKAYAPQMKVAYSFEEAMKEAKGRIFIIDDDSLSCYNRLENKKKNINKLKSKNLNRNIKSILTKL